MEASAGAASESREPSCGALCGFSKKRSTAARTAAAGFGFEDGFAQVGAVGDAVGEPGGELLHLADSVAVRSVASDLAGGDDLRGARGFGGLFEGNLVDQHLEVGADHAVTV